jgi:hypothetical protein
VLESPTGAAYAVQVVLVIASLLHVCCTGFYMIDRNRTLTRSNVGTSGMTALCQTSPAGPL